jgi:hypothetical protein
MRSPDDSGWILVQECMMIALIHRLHDIVLPLRRWGSRPRVYNHVHVRVKCATPMLDIPIHYLHPKTWSWSRPGHFMANNIFLALIWSIIYLGLIYVFQSMEWRDMARSHTWPFMLRPRARSRQEVQWVI